MYTCIDKTMQIVLERGSIDARVLSTGGGGGRGEASPPKRQSSPPNIFIRFGKTLLSNSHTLAINFLSAINKVQSSKSCHRLSINRSC